jgi:hypothetical protein
VTGASFLLSDDSLLKKRIQSVCVLVWNSKIRILFINYSSLLFKVGEEWW